MDSLEGAPGDDFEGGWNPIFDTERNLNEDAPYGESLGILDPDGSSLSIFCQEYESPVPSFLAADIQRFCATSSPPHLSLSTGRRCKRARAWLDDREYSTGYARTYHNRLDDVQIQQCMTEKRFGKSYLPDADRRLVYVPDLDASFIAALSATASRHQVPTLKDAIWKHIALQTSICIEMPPLGYSVFSLEFHLPYLALREVHPFLKDDMDPPHSKPTRRWTDLSFLDIPPAPGKSCSIWGLHAASISFAMCGSDHTRWTGYAFVDTHFNNASDLEDTEDEEFEDELMQDPIASDGEGIEVDSNMPVWAPREYWLRNLDFRSKQVLQEWTFLARSVEVSVLKWEREHLTHTSTQTRTEIFHWLIPILRLLRQIRGCLSETVLAWKKFDTPSGDVRYLTDLRVRRATLHLHQIRATMRKLQCIEQTFAYLDDTCKEYKNTLETQMNLESNQINLESNRINYNSHGIALQNSHISLKNHNVSLEVRRVASANLRTAQEAFSINQFLLLVGIAVAYLGNQQEIFPFRKNQWSFFASALLMVLGLRVYVFISNLVGHLRWYKQLVERLARFLPPESTDGNDDLENMQNIATAYGTQIPIINGVYPVSSNPLSGSCVVEPP
ncbi:hypothetical protein P154DRAFT_267602 [Amniculicola lignicola CBS 123094]|uniref:Uncharacterized protein n=1 Tax=Amniculicola lignicola CBS 123094 TaxID=1392246 RepID=A0A6A5W810_9PLEO|nr:hypothetical protein P154DRAFT_267602 [Amniculicola lignicola CBS 123094]